MPRVGDREFAYNAAGMNAAKKESERTGLPVEMKGNGTQRHYTNTVSRAAKSGGLVTAGRRGWGIARLPRGTV